MIELKNAVHSAKIKLGLSASELSKLIGHSRNYITESLRIGVSTEKQAEIVNKINEAVEVELINRGIATDREIEKYQKKLEKAFNDRSVKDFQINASIKETEELKAALAISKSLNNSYERICEDYIQKIKNISSDFADVSRDKSFMKKELRDKNAIIKLLIASNVLLGLALVVKYAGWV